MSKNDDNYGINYGDNLRQEEKGKQKQQRQ